ncbi:FG-GAP-like repeat-containing protein [Flavobacterium tyrosinilyticum]|uniref:FG-GAP-like repeat-containing protein n=1 Tax=Flavobacterium tyrosinilyticum TaxID=1658740 RepID=UPI00202EEA1F|nr:FG-GAP-like repeat-containing protein [Flavobacterium tyrosinilyticum]MCM0665641.1 FG-GAP-like repeat-containing protein [Flavobacterium tyrosinilyticum]
MKKFYIGLLFLLVGLLGFGQNQSGIISEETTIIKRVDSSEENSNVITTTAASPNLLSAANSLTGSSAETGILEGDLSISLNGNANYTVPIKVPKGINGIEPSVNITYNSQNGLNGNIARGWDISGISSITRIPSTKFHDGVIDPVDFNALDRFALDGQRLIVKNGTNGVYGADKTVYETEYFSNLKITSYGVSPFGSSYGPAYFLVEYPDGSKAYYGNSTDSRSILEWSILYFENAQGVRINYSYVLLNNALYVDSIKFGALGNNSQPNEVKFVYEDRGVPDNIYVGGKNIIRSKRLKEIKVFTNGIGFRNYSVSYLNVDRINKITEISGDGTKSYNPTVFDYNMVSEEIKYIDITTSLDIGNVKSLNAAAVSGDFDADGKMDCLVYPTLGTEAKTKYWLYAGIESGFNMGLEHKVGAFEDIFPATFLSEENKILPQGWVVAKNTDSNYTFSVYSMVQYLGTPYVKKQHDKVVSIPKNSFPKKIASGDFNGDGLTDILIIDRPQNNLIEGKQVCFIDLKRDNTESYLTIGRLADALSVTARTEVADFNGDGKSDLFVFDTGILTIYSLNAENRPVVLYRSPSFDNAFSTTFPYSTTKFPILIGDYNGDGKSDFLIPKAYGSSQWYKYTSTGSTFIKEEKTYPVDFSSNNSSSTYNYIATDFNNDGRTDLIKVLNFIDSSKGYITIQCFRNTSDDFKYEPQISSTGPKSDINIYALPVYLPQSLNASNTIGNKVNSTLEIAFFNQNKIHFFNSGYDYKKENLITNITTGNGVQESISYIPLNTQFANTYQNTPIYKPSKDIAVYPNLDILIDPNLYVVSKQEQQSKDNYKKRLFAYYGAVSNAEGLGFMGFRSVMQTDWYNDNNPMFSNIVKNDIDLRGANVENYYAQGFREPLIVNLYANTPKTIVKGQGTDYTVTQSDHLVATESIVLKPNTHIKAGSTFSAKINQGANDSPNTPTDYITKSVLTYQNNLLANKVFKLTNTSTKQFNTLTNTNSEENTEYDAYDNPINSTAVIKEGASTVQTTVSNVAYYNNTASSPYIIGRPSNKSESVSVTGSTMSSEEIYDYNANGLLNQVKRKGTNTNYITENNNYDSFGNIINKKISAVGLTPRETTYSYDISGRFLTKITDSEKLATQFEYNTNGTLKSETNPYNLATSYTYDSWFKRLTVKNEKLNKIISYKYTRNAENTIVSVTTDALDGSATEETFDDLGRKIKTSQKDLNGNFTSVSFMYDIFDRNYKTSEPYFGSNASQWNETKFDIYSRPEQSKSFTSRTITALYNGLTSTIVDGQKTKSFTKNAIGNLISTAETTGGTIKYDYYANGNLKQTDYNGVKITIEQDGWGRKTSMTDPSAGVYTYKNNDFGELEVETSKNGEVVTTITRDENGKPIKKTVTGSGTDTETVYEYNSLTKLLSKTTFTDKKQPVGTNKIITTYTYDDVFKRLLKIEEDKTGVTKFTTAFSYDELGRISTETKEAQLGSKRSTVAIKREYKNGALYQIVDNNTKKVLWQTNTLTAKGQIKESVLGNGIINTNEYDTNGYIEKIKYDKANNQGNVLTLNTKFDFKTDNLENRTNSIFNNYTEKFKYDELDRLVEFTNKLGTQETQNYESSGKIKSNSLGTYEYGTSTKPYQNTSISLTPEAYGYYANREGSFKEGAQSTERKLDVTYNAFKSPLQITESTIDKISFTYNEYNQRSTMFYGSMEDEALRPLRKHYAADGTMEIKENIKTGTAEFVTYIGGDGYSAPVALKSNGLTTADYLYLHRDYQGTILAVTDANANTVEKRLFDAWGAIIKVENGAGTALAGLTVLDRGYTGHEHLQSVGLINMNARLYDPMLHRFLQTDNYIQDITNTQNFNQYGYVYNNPLLYIDPSGNVSQGGGGDCKGCGIGIGPGDQTGSSWDIEQFGKDYGIDRWLNKNFNLKNWDRWRKDKISLNNIFGRHKQHGPPPNMSSYVSLNNASLTGAYPGTNYSNTKYNITSDYSTYLRPVDFEKVAVKTNEVATSTAIITAGLEATGKAAPYMLKVGKYGGNLGTLAQITDNSLKLHKGEANGGISAELYSYRMIGTGTSWAVGTAVSEFSGPYGVLAAIIIGGGFQAIEYSYDIIAPQISSSYNGFIRNLYAASYNAQFSGR